MEMTTYVIHHFSNLCEVEDQLFCFQKGCRDRHLSHISKEDRCWDDHLACLSHGGRACHSLLKERVGDDYLSIQFKRQCVAISLFCSGEWMTINEDVPLSTSLSERAADLMERQPSYHPSPKETMASATRLR